MEEALTAQLLGAAAVTALIGVRLTWDERPQASALPALTLQVIDGAPEYSDEGAAGLSSARVQIDCWAASSLAAKQLARAVIAAFPIGMTVGGVTFDGAFLDSGRDFPPEVQAGGDIKVYRRTLDFQFWHSA